MTIYSIKPFISKLVQARKQKRITQRRLADNLNLPQSYISKIESATIDIGVSKLIEIARMLGFEVMLVPIPLVPHVEALTGADQDFQNALYRAVPDDEDDFDND